MVIDLCTSCEQPIIPPEIIALREMMSLKEFVGLVEHRHRSYINIERVAPNSSVPHLFLKRITAREIECIAESAIHGNQAAAAGCIGISPQTLKNHLYQLYNKLGVSGFSSALSQLGWLQIPSGLTVDHPAQEESA